MLAVAEPFNTPALTGSTVRCNVGWTWKRLLTAKHQWMLNETALRSHRLTDDSTSTIAQFTWLDSELTAKPPLHYIHYGWEMRDQSYLCNNCIKSFILFVTRNDLCIKPHSKLPMQIKLTTHPHKLANLFKLLCTCEINSTAKIETMHYTVIPQTVLYNTNMKLQSNHHTMVISTVFWVVYNDTVKFQSQ